MLLNQFVQHRQNNRLAYRLLFYVVVCSSFFALLASAIQLYWGFRADINHIRGDFSFAAESYGPAIGNSLYKVDLEQLRLQLQGLLQLRDMVYVEVVEPRGDDLFAIADGDQQMFAKIAAGKARGLKREFPIVYHPGAGEETNYGTLTMAASLAGPRKRLLSRMMVLLVTNGIKTFLASLCILSIFYFVLTRHVSAITRYLGKWAPEQEMKPLTLRRRTPPSEQTDELDILVSSINARLHRIDRYHRELSDTNRLLRRSDDRFRAYIQNSSEGIFCFDLEQSVDIRLPVDEQLDLIYRFAVISEINDAYARIGGCESSQEMIGWRLGDFMPRTIPSNVDQLKALIQADYNLAQVESFEVYPNGTEKYLLNNVSGFIEDGHLVRAWGAAMDITELKNAQKQLQIAEERYRTVADFTFDWEYWEGPDGTMRYVSPSCQRITGYEAQAFMEEPGLLARIVDNADRERWHAHRHKVTSDLKPHELHFRIRHQNGGMRWIEHVCQPVFDLQGEFSGTRASNRDITARKKVEAELKKSESRLRAFMENTEDQICGRDIDGGLIFWNKAFANACKALFGIEPHVGLKTGDLQPAEQREQTRHLVGILPRVFEGERFRGEFPYTSPNGETRFYEISWSPIPIGGKVAAVAEIVRDISARKKVEAELRTSEKQLRLMADALPVLIAYIDADLRYQFANAAYSRFFGLPLNQLIGRSPQTVLGPTVYQHVATHIDEALAGNQVNFEITIPIDDRQRQLESTYLPHRADGDRVLGFFVLVQDVTQRNHRELELKRHREELTHVSRLATMGELTASLAHELNQPLTAILSNAQAALRFLNRPDPDMEEVVAILADIVADDRRAGLVIRRLRGFLRRGEMVLKPWDLNELIREVVTLVHSDAVVRNVNIGIELEEPLPPAIVDRVQLQQVLLNLIINGLEAMEEIPPGGRGLTIRSALTPEGSITVAVVDSGPGLADGIAERVFEPFFTNKPDGMGMGLAINKSIIEAHKGRLWAENNPERGVTFLFSIPADYGE